MTRHNHDTPEAREALRKELIAHACDSVHVAGSTPVDYWCGLYHDFRGAWVADGCRKFAASLRRLLAWPPEVVVRIVERELEAYDALMRDDLTHEAQALHPDAHALRAARFDPDDCACPECCGVAGGSGACMREAARLRAAQEGAGDE